MEISLCPKCSVCLKEYSDECLPRNLKCGHSLCSLCIDQLYDFDQSCSECRKRIEAQSILDPAINHSVLRISRIFNLAKLEPGNITAVKSISDLNPVRERQKSAGICSEHGHHLFFMCMRCITCVCRGCLAVSHPDPPRGRCSIAGLQEGMNKISSMHQKVIKSYLREADQTDVKLKEIVKSFTDVFQYCKDAEGDDKTRQKRLLEIDEEKLKAQSQITSLEKLTKSLRQVSDIIKETKDFEGLVSAHEHCLKMEDTFEKFMTQEGDRKIQSFMKLFLPHNVDLLDLLRTETPVYAIQEKEGKCRWAEVGFKDNSILLYSLRDGNPPKEGAHLPFELLREAIPQMSPTVFMEFGGDGEYKGRSHIRMFGDTARGRQAVLLCSGERGPSYRDTCFYDTYFHGDDDACLKGGDYENNDGTGGRAIVDDITDDDVYKMVIREGLMVGWPADEQYRLGSFRLYTYDYDWITAEHAFGIVTENMELVTDGVGRECDFYEDPKVLDCGLVLTM